MRRLLIGFGLALLLGATTAASAVAAPPEFGRCIKKAKAEGAGFSDAGCTKAVGTGAKFEWTPAIAKAGFSIALKEVTILTLETTTGTKIICHGVSGTGQVVNPNEVGGLVLTLTGCETAGGQVESAGEPAGTVVTQELSGALGVVTVGMLEGREAPAKDKLALALHGPPASGVIFNAACNGLPIDEFGSLLLPVPANKMFSSATAKLTGPKGEQKPDHFAGGVEDEHTLETSVGGGPRTETSLTAALTQINEESFEASSIN